MADKYQRYERKGIRHSGIHSFNDRVIVVVPQNKNDNLCYTALTIFNVKNQRSFEIAANEVKQVCPTIVDLLNLCKRNNNKLFGHILFNETYLSVLKSLKDIEMMSLNEFKLFLRCYIDKREKYQNQELYMPATFQDDLITRTFIEMGYNPINRRNWFDRFLEKYLADKEVEELWRRL